MTNAAHMPGFVTRIVSRVSGRSGTAAPAASGNTVVVQADTLRELAGIKTDVPLADLPRQADMQVQWWRREFVRLNKIGSGMNNFITANNIQTMPELLDALAGFVTDYQDGNQRQVTLNQHATSANDDLTKELVAKEARITSVQGELERSVQLLTVVEANHGKVFVALKSAYEKNGTITDALLAMVAKAEASNTVVKVSTKKAAAAVKKSREEMLAAQNAASEREAALRTQLAEALKVSEALRGELKAALNDVVEVARLGLHRSKNERPSR